MRSLLTLIIAVSALAGSTQSAPALPKGEPISPDYVAKFATCDAQNSFNGVTLPIYGPPPQRKVLWYGCKKDPSRFEQFDRITAAGTEPEAVVITSKLAHDDDGSMSACHGKKGPTSQCTTSLMLGPTKAHPCQVTGVPACVPVNPDEVGYVVMPASAPKHTAIDGGEFRRLSGLAIGDYGVVIVGDRTVPVIIADSGSAFKMGEGSTALLKKLSASGAPNTISSGVTFVLFPRTRQKAADLNPDNLSDTVKDRALGCYRLLVKTASPADKCQQAPVPQK